MEIEMDILIKRFLNYVSFDTQSDEENEKECPSTARQLELARFLHDSARFYNCQFVIATHSPFLLAMPGARIYDLDSEPIATKRWTELENVRATWEFFQSHKDEFK